jgi:hypothetical protein
MERRSVRYQHTFDCAKPLARLEENCEYAVGNRNVLPDPLDSAALETMLEMIAGAIRSILGAADTSKAQSTIPAKREIQLVQPDASMQLYRVEGQQYN